jgi:CDP-paratose 2-epimerase
MEAQGSLRKKMNKKTVTGIVGWFEINEYDKVEAAIKDLRQLGITQLRTNISWADWHRPGGKEWYDWLFDKIGSEFNILPCVLYTPPSIAIKPYSSAPPATPKDYADFIDTIITAYGEHFEYIELWNEPNNKAEYDHTLDPGWEVFARMITGAAYWSKQRGKKTVLGGMSPVDVNWLQIMFDKGVMQYIDVVAMHGFPDVYDYNWEGWKQEVQKVKNILVSYSHNAEVWITEAGFSTWQKNERRQVKEFILAMESGADRMYWYGLNDMVPQIPSNDKYDLDEREYYFGMKNNDGSAKLLYTLLLNKGISQLKKYEWLTQPLINGKQGKYILITGGAGFVGVNLADRFLSQGDRVLIFDNLSRQGVENNLFWLKEKYPDTLQIMIADIRDRWSVIRAVENAKQVFHFAAQVAVTSSLTDPFHDFEVNASGTLNLLQAIRNSPHQPPVIFTSTNKVYGDLLDLKMISNGTRYHPQDNHFRKHGISEHRNLDFHSPYGCTKGIADQYILDYARTFGLRSVVFRMSCIYGPHQFGTEDQGWVAHFLIKSIKKTPITIYGDGKQVRDILFVEDLVDAFVLAMENIEEISGNAFNIGGGINNTISLIELLNEIEKVSGERPQVIFDDWRPSDQKYYVSDFRKFTEKTGWTPKVTVEEGIERLYNWLASFNNIRRIPKKVVRELSQ